MVADILGSTQVDRIFIKDLLVRCTIGVTAEERREKEDVLLNIVLGGDFSGAAKSDQFGDAVDYRQIKKRIFSLVEKSHYSLIEALAERVASLCLATAGVSEVQVTAEKPSVLRFARSVGIEITRRSGDRKPVQVYLGLGSNIDPEKNIQRAIGHLKEHVKVVKLSKLYQTQALGRVDCPPFINGVIQIETSLLPLDLKYSVIRPIEDKLGRIRTSDKNAPRTIDIDIVAYDDIAIKEDDLVLPDPEIAQREFLAVPLSELSPDLVLPGMKQALREIIRKFEHSSMKPLEECTSRVKREVFG